MHYPNIINQNETLGDRLHQFILAAADTIDELIALLPSTTSMETHSVNETMLRRYNDLVQQIRRMAHDYNLTGLQSTCALVENNLLLLQDTEHTLTADECVVLREWPELLFSYLVNQADLNSTTAFVNNLSTVWPICLPDETISDKLQQLMGNTAIPPEPAAEALSKVPTDMEPQLIEQEMTASPELELAQAAFTVTSADIESQQIEQEMSSPSALEPALDALPQAPANTEPQLSEHELSPLPASELEQDAMPEAPADTVPQKIEQEISSPPVSELEQDALLDESVDIEPLQIDQELFSLPASEFSQDGLSDEPADIDEPQQIEQELFSPSASGLTQEGLSDDSTEIAPQQIEQEMVTTLASELLQLDDQFITDLDTAIHGSDEERDSALSNYLDFLERLNFTVESVGLTALAAFFVQLSQQIKSMGDGLTLDHEALLQLLPIHLATYLADPGMTNAGAGLISLLTDSAWLNPVPDATVLPIQKALINVQILEMTPQVDARPSQARREDVSLEIPDDVHPELLNGLLQELPVQVSAFFEAIEKISLGTGDVNDIERAMRAAHTLKGAANTVGVVGIANLTHHLEDILAALLNAKKLPHRSLSDVLINASDCLETMSEYLQGMGPAPEGTLEVLQEVLNCATRIDNLGVDADMPDITAMPDATSMTEKSTTDPQLPEHQSGVPKTSAEQSLRIPAPLVDELLRLSGETLTTNSQIQENLLQSVTQTELIRRQHKLLQQLVVELEELVDIRGISSPKLVEEYKGDDLDDLEFEHYNELHTVTRRLMEAATDAQELTDSVENELGALKESLDDQHRLQIANQNAVIRIRMVTVSSIISRLKRGVRQTARLLDKSVEFTIKGENTSIDGNVLNDLMDPLMHILRNAVDHGIESPEKRVAAGKSPEGHIELTFAREGNSIVVRCSDDGPGLDYEAILSSAEQKGMVIPEYRYSNDELERMILLPGFSTRGSASQISGRGVGMDVVQSRIEEKKGSMTLKSRHNQGLTVEMRLPATLLSTHTLIVRQRNKYLAISSRNIEDVRYCMHEQIMEIGPRQFFRVGENMCQLDKLETLLSMPHDRHAQYMPGFPVLLTRMNDGTMRGILVQEIMDSREVVMKKFGHFVPRSQGVVGAVILGNGSIAPVIDLVELLHAPVGKILAVQNPALQSAVTAESERNALRALVVDDSLSARRAMSHVLKDAGYEVRTANDGLDAVDILSKYIPDIILSDMEMPRMNGLELAAHVRYAERTRDIPVIMITSRSTEKHRQMSTAAGVNLHIVKPFNDDTLLDHVARLTAR